ncbi:MAG: alpha-1,2-fucosyltransferase [Rhodoferax sp.]
MWPEKVIARIEGGLGNQLFQYAAARSLADRLGCGLALDLRGLALNGDRPYMLGRYRVRADIASPSELAPLPNWRASRVGRWRAGLSQSLPELFSYPLFWSTSFAYDPRFECIRRPVYLVGYWQSERYFSWNRERLLEDLTLTPHSAIPTEVLDRFEDSKNVALHIRRGDYVSNPAAAQFHGLCDIKYYTMAVSHLVQQHPIVRLRVFSDDPEWVRKHLHLSVPAEPVDVVPVDDAAHVDLELMSRCRHHIIANSSFSWWGAWLCRHTGQTVYAPKRWFLDQKTDTSDIIPLRWLKLG